MKPFRPIMLLGWLFVTYLITKSLSLMALGHVITNVAGAIAQADIYLIVLLLPSPLLQHKPCPTPAGNSRQGGIPMTQKVLTFIDRAIILMMALTRWATNTNVQGAVISDTDSVLRLAGVPTWCEEIANSVLTHCAAIPSWLQQLSASKLVPPLIVTCGDQLIMAIESAVQLTELAQSGASGPEKRQAAINLVQQWLQTLPAEVQNFVTPDLIGTLIDVAVSAFNVLGKFTHKPLLGVPTAIPVIPAPETIDTPAPDISAISN